MNSHVELFNEIFTELKIEKSIFFLLKALPKFFALAFLTLEVA